MFLQKLSFFKFTEGWHCFTFLKISLNVWLNGWNLISVSELSVIWRNSSHTWICSWRKGRPLWSPEGALYIILGELLLYIKTKQAKLTLVPKQSHQISDSLILTICNLLNSLRPQSTYNVNSLIHNSLTGLQLDF